MESAISGYSLSGNISKRLANAVVDPKTEGKSLSETQVASLSSVKSVRISTTNPPLCCSCRLIVSVVSCLGLLNLYTLRFSMSVAMTWMVDRRALLKIELMSNKTNNLGRATCNLKTSPTSFNLAGLRLSDFPNGEFVWSEDVQNTIKSSFYWGYVFTQIPGGWLAERYGGKRFIGWAILTCSIGNLLIPTAARLGYQFLIALRVLQGIAQGFVWPSMYVIWARWTPFPEKQILFSLINSGALLGIAITLPVVVILAESENIGWQAVFYASGISGIVWTLAWYRFVYDTPLLHPRISEREKAFINLSLTKTITKHLKNQPPTPWKALLTSVPVWVLVACNTCNDLTLYLLIDSLFVYMTSVLGYNERVARFIDSIPYVLSFVISILAGAIYDKVTAKQICSQTAARKIGNSIGTVVPAFLVFAAGFMDCSQSGYAIILIIACTSVSGIQYGSGFLSSFLDIAPQHTGVTFGIANTVSIVAGVSEPFLLSAMTKDHLLSQWRNVFTLLALLFLLDAAIFDLFGTAKIQEWALPPSEKESYQLDKTIT